MASSDEYQQIQTWREKHPEYIRKKRNELIDAILDKEERENITFINLEINKN